MRKTLLLLTALIGLPAGLWAAMQPVRVPCPEMKMASGNAMPDPCPMPDCCRISPPGAPQPALISGQSQVKAPGFVHLPALLPVRLAVAPVRDRLCHPPAVFLPRDRSSPSSHNLPLRV